MIKRLTSHPEFISTVIVLFLFLLISLFYFHPLMSGKVVKSSDVILIQGMQKDIVNYRETHDGEDAYWSKSMFSGMPAYTIHVAYQGSILHTIRRMIVFCGSPTGYFFYGMLSFFALLKLFKVQTWMGFAGGLAFGLFSYHLILVEAGHAAKLEALLAAPAVLASIYIAFRHKPFLGGALLMLTLGIELLTSHVQITYYLLIIVMIYGLYELINTIQNKNWKSFVLAMLCMIPAAGIAFGMTATMLLPLREYNEFSIRGPSELSVEPSEKGTKAESDKKSKNEGVDRDYAFNWSNGRDELLTLLIPNFKGGTSHTVLDEKSHTGKKIGSQIKDYPMPMYFGTQPFTSGPMYASAIICFLFIIGMALSRTGIKWVLLYVTMLFAVLSLGKNSFSLFESFIIFIMPLVYYLTKRFIPKNIPTTVYGLGLSLATLFIINVVGESPASAYKITDLLFDYLPLYNKFRAPASMLSLVAVSIPWLALLGAQALTSKDIEENEKLIAIYTGAGVLLLICLSAALMPDFWNSSYQTPSDQQIPKEILPEIIKDRESLLVKDAYRSFFFILITAALCWTYVKGYLKSAKTVGIALSGLIFIDLFVVDIRYLWTDDYQKESDYETHFFPKEADAFIKKNFGDQYFRVFPASRNAFNDGSTPYHLNTIGGYNAAKLKRYQQLIEAHIGKFNLNVINMLNTKFIIHNKQFNHPLFKHLYTSKEGEIVYQNMGNYGPAWINQDFILAKSPDDALALLDSTNSYVSAIVETDQPGSLSSVSKDSIDLNRETVKLIKADNREMVYEYNSDKNRFVTFSEVYYPKGWTATIDGKEANIYHTNFVLRGLSVPKGKHKIVFNYEPEVIENSANISRICSGLFLLLFISAIALEVRNFSKKEKEEDN